MRRDVDDRDLVSLLRGEGLFMLLSMFHCFTMLGHAQLRLLLEAHVSRCKGPC